MRKLKITVFKWLICSHKVSLWHGHCLGHLVKSSGHLFGLLKPSLGLGECCGGWEAGKGGKSQAFSKRELLIPGRAVISLFLFSSTYYPIHTFQQPFSQRTSHRMPNTHSKKWPVLSTHGLNTALLKIKSQIVRLTGEDLLSSQLQLIEEN